MSHLVNIQVSAKTYWGFRTQIKTELFQNLPSHRIIEIVKTEMKSFFRLHNLKELEEGVNKLDLYLHRNETEIGPDNIVYACDHKHEEF